MKRLFLALILLAISSVASAATIEANLDWAGTDSSGAVEASTKPPLKNTGNLSSGLAKFAANINFKK